MPYLSAVLLADLVLNATLGWSWADPIAGRVIATVAVREGLEAWRGEGCACGQTLTDQVTLEVTRKPGLRRRLLPRHLTNGGEQIPRI